MPRDIVPKTSVTIRMRVRACLLLLAKPDNTALSSATKHKIDRTLYGTAKLQMYRIVLLATRRSLTMANLNLTILKLKLALLGIRLKPVKDTYEAANSAGYLLADDEIVVLAKEVLSSSTYEEAERIAAQLSSRRSKHRARARAKLWEIVCPPPKRPLFYAQQEIRFLPGWTRNILRYLGDYVDMLVKVAAYERESERRILNVPFGAAIRVFSRNWPLESRLTSCLERYNSLLYRPAKHDFKLPSDRSDRRFTAREAVLSAYVTMQLGMELAKISKGADSAKTGNEDI